MIRLHNALGRPHAGGTADLALSLTVPRFPGKGSASRPGPPDVPGRCDAGIEPTARAYDGPGYQLNWTNFESLGSAGSRSRSRPERTSPGGVSIIVQEPLSRMSPWSACAVGEGPRRGRQVPLGRTRRSESKGVAAHVRSTAVRIAAYDRRPRFLLYSH